MIKRRNAVGIWYELVFISTCEFYVKVLHQQEPSSDEFHMKSSSCKFCNILRIKFWYQSDTTRFTERTAKDENKLKLKSFWEKLGNDVKIFMNVTFEFKEHTLKSSLTCPAEGNLKGSTKTTLSEKVPSRTPVKQHPKLAATVMEIVVSEQKYYFRF